jgi:hypothetical protein
MADKDTNDITKLKGDALCEAIYDIMNLMVGGNNLSSRIQLSSEAGRAKEWVYDRYRPWLKKHHPGSFENVEKVMEYGKQM